MTYVLETRAVTSETRRRLETNGMKVLRKIVDKTKIDRITSQQISESCCIQPINDWVKEEEEEEEEENGTNMQQEWMLRI